MNRKKMRTKKYITVIPHAPFITMVALLLLCTGAAKAKDYHMGTYNIRCINATLTGLRDWDNRKEYVAKIITDNRFDVIGLQEIANDDQENDLRQLLPEYSMVPGGVKVPRRTKENGWQLLLKPLILTFWTGGIIS